MSGSQSPSAADTLPGMLARYQGMRVLVTGHTGFKGAWLCAWLRRHGADVTGLALAPEAGRPSLFEAAGLEAGMRSCLGDIREWDTVRQCVDQARPDIIFHLAAQALVRRSYGDPLGTFASNVMGSAHVLEAARQTASVRAVVCVTTDKVYDNREWAWGYREDDALGGKDPYSASKACAELVAAVYQKTLLPADGRVALATARGGNVVGGGDWSEDRLVPDIVRALVAGEEIVLRHPHAMRPWQHVLELCRGYLQLGDRLLHEPQQAIGAWNFGPERENEIEVGQLTADFCRMWGAKASQLRIEPASLKEAGILKLDNSKARYKLGWRPLLGYQQTLEWTAQWYRDHQLDHVPAGKLVDDQIARYEELTPS
jgi:CDP-glucose 4,6-dehydratase